MLEKARNVNGDTPRVRRDGVGLDENPLNSPLQFSGNLELFSGKARGSGGSVFCFKKSKVKG